MSGGSETGAIALLVMVGGAVVAWPVAWVTMRIYRRAVLRAMVSVHGEREAGPAPVPARREPAGALGEVSVPSQSTAAWALGVYLVSGLALSLVDTAVFAAAVPDSTTAIGFMLSAFTNMWPGLVAAGLAVGARHPGWRWAVVLYAALSLAAGWLADYTTADYLVFFGLTIGLPVVLHLLFDRPSVRGVGPMVLVACTLGVLAVNFVISETYFSWEPVASLTARLGLIGDLVVVLASAGMAFALGSALGFLLVIASARFYRSGRVSDQMIRIGTAIVWFSLFQAGNVSLVATGWGILSFVGQNVAFWVVALAAFRLRPPSGRPPRLLILRVFALGRRSSATFREITRIWRGMGRGVVVAGPDLAADTIEPDEFLTFASGGLRRLFISRPEHLADRLREIERPADLDRTYRMVDFFCHGDMWQQVVEVLMRSSHVVLMDLRSFSEANAGVVFELETLARCGAAGRSLLLVDRTTDRGHLDEVLGGLGIRPVIVEYEGLKQTERIASRCLQLAASGLTGAEREAQHGSAVSD